MQERVFLDRAAGNLALTVDHAASMAMAVAVAILSGGRGRRNVRNLLRVGVLAANLGDADVTGLASLGEGIVATVEVLALLQAGVGQNSRQNEKNERVVP